MPSPDLPTPADTTVLGAHVDGDGTRFALWAPRASRVELALVDADRTQQNHDMTLAPDGVWTIHVPGVEAEQRYGYRVHGEWDPDNGKRFNPAKLLLDPYARAITAGVDYAGPIRDHPEGDDFLPDETDSAFAVPLSVVVADSPPPTPIRHRLPLSESVIYEVHVKGFTRLHPAVPEHLRGTYAGMAYPAVLDYLKELGITAVELLPIHQFVSEPFLIGRGLSNYWGYNTLGFFAPHSAYGSVGTTGEQVTEFKRMVSAYHEAGIEVILDVVYNHTGEGGHEGPTLAFRGIDHAGYYRLTDDQRNDYDVTGTGNSVDTSQPGVLRLIMDSLRYWVTEMGVDGFRFDLATTLMRDRDHHVVTDGSFAKAIAEDPVLRDVKIIAEPWDVGPYGYQVGNFGHPWSEWNDTYRGYVRDFWRGATHGVRGIGERLCGSPGTFAEDRGPGASINFVTAHDGMTLRDLVSYNDKHNEDNGEDNRDGSDDNRSWNCGHEGDTDDAGVNALRHRQAKNILATLLLSTGVPMITAGDEFGRTQGGNNNAYCQDGPISWVHWDTRDEWSDLHELAATLLDLRAFHPVLRPAEYRHGQPVAEGRKNLAWFSGAGNTEMTQDDWDDGGRRHLGVYTSDEQTAFLTWYHSGAEPVTVRLPADPWAIEWTVRAHTGTEDEFSKQVLPAGAELTLPGRTVVLLQARL
ncbi:glycogen debranching protein GlgX [Microlunatus sp. Y2014]|uniref:glycogen debranching protein GlgX n=1 Tax=Microlunatus sp. Y2014 TaxID=3418488 RepID=UPI003DA704D2